MENSIIWLQLCRSGGNDPLRIDAVYGARIGLIQTVHLRTFLKCSIVLDARAVTMPKHARAYSFLVLSLHE